MSAHQVEVNDGAEYAGERYIRCWNCSQAPKGQVEVMYDGTDVESLLTFLEEHEAYGPCQEYCCIGFNNTPKRR